MYKNKVILLVIITLVLTGCTKIDSNNIDNIITATMSREIKSVNTVSTGYELYMPVGVIQLVDNEYNQKLKVRNTHVYLYVDIVSYYYKNSLNYQKEEEYNYYYKELLLNGHTGYIGINKLEDGKMFTKIVYNYAKIEFYSSYDNMPVILADSLMILNSIKFNDSLIKIELDSFNNEGREIKYELDKPVDSESTFSKYLQEYVEPEETEVILPDTE